MRAREWSAGKTKEVLRPRVCDVVGLSNVCATCCYSWTDYDVLFCGYIGSFALFIIDNAIIH